MFMIVLPSLKIRTSPMFRDMINEANVNGNETMDFSEFLSLMAHSKGPNTDAKEEMREAIRVFHEDGNQKYDNDAGEKLTDSEFEDMICEVDVNGDLGQID
ncbi:hypothetical protein V8B97DRAFT_1914104 [Scleroderma yunnanense]